jgi:purine-binding chemotaxis protein CheW
LKEEKEEKQARLDWREIRQRLAAVGEALCKGGEADPGELQRILAERARDLAQEPAGEEVGSQLEIIEFQLAHERYGIESSLVSEVLPLREYTVVPCTPAFVLGIVNVRGRIVSVVNLKKFFDLPAKGLTELNRVIILRTPQMELGLLADSVASTRLVRLAELQAGLPTLTGIREEYLRGITGDGLIVLAAARLLADPGLLVREEVG